MLNPISFIKSNIISLLTLIIVISYVTVGRPFPIPLNTSFSQGNMSTNLDLAESAIAPSSKAGFGRDTYLPEPQLPPTDSPDRIQIFSYSLSLLVNDVTASLETIHRQATQVGGFLVSSHLNRPEEASSGTITIQIPSPMTPDFLKSIKSTAVKVVSEEISGQDVTDQYVDTNQRLAILETTKTKYQAILDRASQVPDILQVQQQLTNLQSQIDSLKGQQQYLEKSSQLTRITVFLSTDELALPYVPDHSWRPNLVFKEAVRSLILTLRSLANTLIWLAVYSPIILFAGLTAWLVFRKLQSKPK